MFEKQRIKNLEVYKKSTEFEYMKSPYKINEIYDKSVRVLDFKNFNDINNVKFSTDADEFGGDTVADMDYNIENDSCM